MTKELFHKLYIEDDKVVLCTTRELAREFLETAYSFGYKWKNNNFVKDFNWNEHRYETCYRIEDGVITFGSWTLYTLWDYEIVHFDLNR